MNCENVRQILNDYIDGELNDLESRRVELHIAGCESCAREERQLRMVCSLVGSCGAQKAPAGILNGIHIELEKERVVPIKKKRSYAGVMALAASFMLALAGGYYFNIFDKSYDATSTNPMVAESRISEANEVASAKLAAAPMEMESAMETVSVETPEPQPVETPDDIINVEDEAPRMAAAPAYSQPLAPREAEIVETSVAAAPRELAREEEPTILAAVAAPAAAPADSGLTYRDVFAESDAGSTGYAASPYSNMSEGERARAAVASAINDMESGGIAVTPSRGSVGGAAPRYSSAGRTLSAVSYDGTPGFEYYEDSSGPGVMDYVISQNINELRRTRGQNLYARARDVLYSSNPGAAVDQCEKIVTSSIVSGSTVSYQKTANAVVVKGPFSELVKIRIDVLDKCQESKGAAMTRQEKDQLIKAATSSYQFAPSQPSILEIVFTNN